MKSASLRWMLLVLLLPQAGCALHPVLAPANQRPFEMTRDAFAFDNQVELVYALDPLHGITTPIGRNPDAEYYQHCFVLSRSARQFFQFATFDPAAPQLDPGGYRLLVRAVVSHDPSEEGDAPRIVIPGYASLRAFSADWADLLKQELGSSAQSFLQRGNWRMIFPFSEGHQAKTAEMLASEIAANRPPIVHIVHWRTFPRIQINHAVLLFAVKQTPSELRFSVYDPNDARHPTTLVFDRASRRFTFPLTQYFAGGPVDVYEVYRSALF